MNIRGVTIQEKRIAIYCDIFSTYCDLLRYIPFLIFYYKCDRYTPSGLAIATRQELNEN